MNEIWIKQRGSAGGSIAMIVVTQCSGLTRADFLDVPDNGSYTLNSAALPDIQGPAIPRENGCTWTIDLNRERPVMLCGI